MGPLSGGFPTTLKGSPAHTSHLLPLLQLPALFFLPVHEGLSLACTLWLDDSPVPCAHLHELPTTLTSAAGELCVGGNFFPPDRATCNGHRQHNMHPVEVVCAHEHTYTQTHCCSLGTCSALRVSLKSGNRFSYPSGSARASEAFWLVLATSSFHSFTTLHNTTHHTSTPHHPLHEHTTPVNSPPTALPTWTPGWASRCERRRLPRGAVRWR